MLVLMYLFSYQACVITNEAILWQRAKANVTKGIDGTNALGTVTMWNTDKRTHPYHHYIRVAIASVEIGCCIFDISRNKLLHTDKTILKQSRQRHKLAILIIFVLLLLLLFF